MRHKLDGARLKVVRAQEHLDSLKAELRMYLDEKPYEVLMEVKDGYATVRVPEIKIGPPLRLSTLVGDCLTNARAALDYVVWQLALTHFDPPFNPSRSKDREIASFPIISGDRDHRSRTKIDSLEKRKVPSGAMTVIRDVQPENGRNAPMGWLRQLVNTDKHQLPLLTVGHVHSTEILVRRGSAWSKSVSGSGIISMSLRIPTSAALNAEASPVPLDDVQVDCQPDVFVAFEDLSMPQGAVDWLLEEIIKTVADVIPRFDTFF